MRQFKTIVDGTGLKKDAMNEAMRQVHSLISVAVNHHSRRRECLPILSDTHRAHCASSAACGAQVRGQPQRAPGDVDAAVRSYLHSHVICHVSSWACRNSSFCSGTVASGFAHCRAVSATFRTTRSRVCLLVFGMERSLRLQINVLVGQLEKVEEQLSAK